MKYRQITTLGSSTDIFFVEIIIKNNGQLYLYNITWLPLYLEVGAIFFQVIFYVLLVLLTKKTRSFQQDRCQK